MWLHYCSMLILSPLGINRGVGRLDQMVGPFQVFWGFSMLLSRVATPICNSTSNVEVCLFPHIHANTYYCLCSCPYLLLRTISFLWNYWVKCIHIPILIHVARLSQKESTYMKITSVLQFIFTYCSPSPSLEFLSSTRDLINGFSLFWLLFFDY